MHAMWSSPQTVLIIVHLLSACIQYFIVFCYSVCQYFLLFTRIFPCVLYAEILNLSTADVKCFPKRKVGNYSLWQQVAAEQRVIMLCDCSCHSFAKIFLLQFYLPKICYTAKCSMIYVPCVYCVPSFYFLSIHDESVSCFRMVGISVIWRDLLYSMV